MLNILLVPFLLFSLSVRAQDLPQYAVVGEPTQILIKVDKLLNTKKCNLIIDIQDQGIIEKEVDIPAMETFVEITSQKSGSIEIKWKGKTKFRGLNTVPGCDGFGLIKVNSRLNSAQSNQRWGEYFSRLKEPQAACVKFGLQFSEFKIQSIDPNETFVGPDDPSVRDIFSKCESFFVSRTVWGDKDQENFPCAINKINTNCYGVYAQRQADGKFIEISMLDAIKLHFENLPWTTVQQELSEARGKRIKQEEEIKSKQAIEDEKQRRWIASPEYKKQQIAIEKKQLLDQKEAAAKMKKEQIASESESKKLLDNKNANIDMILKCTVVGLNLSFAAIEQNWPKSSRDNVSNLQEKYRMLGVAEHGSQSALAEYNRLYGATYAKWLRSQSEDVQMEYIKICQGWNPK